MYLAHTESRFNVSGQRSAEPSSRNEFLHLGAELCSRGQRPVAEFVSELADLAPEVVADIRSRLEA